MNKRTNNKASLNDIRKAIGALDNGVAALVQRGVERDQWSRLSSDSAFADRIAAAMLDGSGSTANVSLEQLIAGAKSSGALTYIDDNITSAHFPGVGVGGQLEELTTERLGLSHWFSTQKVLDALDSLGYRAATMYEGAHHASNGWDQNTTVAILGSVWRDSRDYGCVGYLWSSRAGRKLDLDVVDDGWHGEDRFLAVRK